ncbi:YitT family protein [Anaerosalibacter massiliensis]|uniref:YitT family protein n=1 Tax=Anaerosalibacter massiliensis TaxID=1347392 RepID=A0A9X2MLB1_9FIRM|nr:YitT family protein [Anaerosalibacter massiliensis]MCR2045608.1 YitT family protein [Anaerosalibacter massiliensis]
MENKEKWYTEVLSYLGITLGVFLMAISLNFFLEPNTIAPGGVTGLAIIIKKSTGIPVYIINLLINIPLFIFGIIRLGKAFGAKTLFATLGLSFFLKFVPYEIVTHDLLLSALFGGVIMGLGLGLVFKFGGTTGGTDLAGAILNKSFPAISIPTFMMAIDMFVVIVAGIVDRKVETSLYSIISLYTSVKVVDLMLEGIGYLKAFLIITNKPKEISKAIMNELERGVTLFKGKGMYTEDDKDILLCVVNRSQFTKVKDIVNTIDTYAFVMVTEMYEVIGEGFKEIKK